MKLTSVLGQKRITLSFEVFPPKADLDFESVRQAAFQVAKLGPDYMSVTYGAGGSTRDNTLALAEDIQKEYGVTAIAHLTCVGATKDSIQEALRDMRHSGIENILALRGDRPQWMEQEPFTDYHYASDLVAAIKEFGGFCIGGACYPEGHPDAANKKEDILNLKKKVDAGCEFLTTQMFFDNNIYYNFLYRVRSAGIEVPVIPGIMPISRASQVKNAIRLSGCNMPERFKNIVDRFGTNKDAMMQAGIIYASEQIIDLIANGVNNIHIYSMNHANVVRGIMENLSEIVMV
ncbi:MAG: methylenetetrahydrofolate reductase [NAD(P)H] [Lachnospiraceae bacterium]|jgi:5,10-methylenetetrahydrofolate reductase, prokaryotic form|uniref:methylenetetrahydrofolate reductase [NAD(P)H] n=1 Tax=Roseburia sp. 1XD42-69 TaxID=2320088 RepID=UPI000EA3E45D|nr:methylenetetrahydrofolate reductase [NAD(P)H] [Roseburia sp. 1XD42-69]MCI8876679.1 methylenetetrahydrofolate reductase [NAD(P)H] [Lachnospiraceae bacterium]MCX4320713.1 methylenetetrahydrofolate reductase [NAD(P)H] [Lachnospiraceae bacterium]RKJ62119.1 methylenetetrahydrofolate reductase [NAD(P)H] [Roseburia sp. 1XD42-69]